MWVDYSKATPEQQATFREANRKIAATRDCKNYMIWITPGGRASRRKGHWNWTEKHAANVRANMEAAARGDDVRSKGDNREFKTADFHLNRERS